VWFYDAADLEEVGRVLRKILDQLPKPDGAAPAADEAAAAGAAPPAYSPAAAPAPAPPAPPAASLPPAAPPQGSEGGGGGGGGGDDAFWDRAVHVTEAAISGQRLVPNESLVVQDTASSQQVGVRGRRGRARGAWGCRGERGLGSPLGHCVGLSSDGTVLAAHCRQTSRLYA
jgi:hypothetical protein